MKIQRLDNIYIKKMNYRAKVQKEYKCLIQNQNLGNKRNVMYRFYKDNNGK